MIARLSIDVIKEIILRVRVHVNVHTSLFTFFSLMSQLHP